MQILSTFLGTWRPTGVLGPLLYLLYTSPQLVILAFFFLDKCFNFEEHIKSICKSSHCHIRNIAKIGKYIDEESANSMLYGLQKHLFSRLQSILLLLHVLGNLIISH